MIRERIRAAVAPAYLLLCLLLGGSSQGIWSNMLLRLLAVAIIAWALIADRPDPLQRSVKWLFALTGAALLLGVIQLIPLPPALWGALPGRGSIVEGFRLLGIAPGWMPITLAPYDTVAAMLTFFPPIAMMASIIVLRTRSSWLAWSLVAGMVAGVIVGIFQSSSTDPFTSGWYFYQFSSFGLAPGFFANNNHMASLLLVTIPFFAALGTSMMERQEEARSRFAAMLVMGGGLFLILIGLILNSSLAGFGLAVPVMLASVWMLAGSRARLLRTASVSVALLGLLGFVVAMNSSLLDRFTNSGAATSASTRQSFLVTSGEIIADHGLTGTGLGTFEQVYRGYENPRQVTTTYINHAHNDYAEVLVEAGIAGAALMLLFLAWWAVTAWSILRGPARNPFAVAAVIASAALLLHSAVDYPLRSSALAAVFAMCLALLVMPRRSAVSDTDLRPVRHLVIG